MDYRELFRVRPGSKAHLADLDPGFKDRYEGREAAEQESARYCQRLRELQDLMYAERKRSLLICLQGMDTAGKDGTINHVLASMNIQGSHVAAFRQPSAEEASHDFLWRAHRVAPARGEVVVFNRSHYEDVLVVRVHELVPKDVWSRRYELINCFEKGLAQSGTTILKFYLHISADEQLRRFKQRLEDPTKQWKISDSDYAERPRWDDYVRAYEDALSSCSTEHAPWFVIPANHKWFRNLAIARIIVEQLEEWRMAYPKPTVDLDHIRKEYHAAKVAR